MQIFRFVLKGGKVEEKYWIWISRINGVGTQTIKKLLKKYESLENIWRLNKKQLMECNGISEKIVDKILDNKYRVGIEKYIEYMKQNGIKLIHINNEKYPKKLKLIYDAPMYLYVKGNTGMLNEDSIAIVGSRICSKYGAMIARKFANQLSSSNINIVSGLAKGIDAYAHMGCLDVGGKTIAVLGNGLDTIYPKENIKIANKILESGGAIISEYVIGTKPERLNFPSRNRIVSGISSGVLVVEAREKSGALITVDFAIEQGKEIFVIPRKY